MMKQRRAPIIVIASVAGLTALFWWPLAPGDDVPADGGHVPHLTVFMNQSIRRMEIAGKIGDGSRLFSHHPHSQA
jgi:hypothetical protein